MFWRATSPVSGSSDEPEFERLADQENFIWKCLSVSKVISEVCCFLWTGIKVSHSFEDNCAWL